MKEKYIELMEKALSAYTDEHILRYFNDVKTNGLKEHGFPRLTANIGILIAHGRRKDLLQIFLEMMSFCCRTIPKVKAANNFSVREIISCIFEIERACVVDSAMTAQWRDDLASIKIEDTYNAYARTPDDLVRNWALFTALSEYFREKAGLCDSREFVELQLCQQQKWFDENGMYCDEEDSEDHQPIMYDHAPRGLLSLLLDQGYRGRYFVAIDEKLKMAGLLTLKMQSPNGEMAFGGRSNQFVLNEPWMIAVLEYEAKRYNREGNKELAARFKAASARALAVTEEWLKKEPIRHTKNRFATETQYGCEKYAYFDKYMITVASNLYVDYLICDDTIPYEECDDLDTCVAETSRYFHKLFMKSGGYGAQLDLGADPEYDANGLGRVHRIGAPSAICLSCPCPPRPAYVVDIPEPFAFSLSSAIETDGVWHFGAEEGCTYELIEHTSYENSATARVACCFGNKKIQEEYYVSRDGIEVTVLGEGKLGYALPAFCFDGEEYTQISVDEHSLSIFYNGWVCRYTTSGKITELDRIAANRNGHYRAFVAEGRDSFNVKIEIENSDQSH